MAISDLFTDPLVNFGLGLSATGGPSLQPRSFGQAALGGLQQGQRGIGLRSDLESAEVQRRLNEERIQSLQFERRQAQRQQEFSQRMAEILGGPGHTAIVPGAIPSSTPPLTTLGAGPKAQGGGPQETIGLGLVERRVPGTGLAGQMEAAGNERAAQLLAAAGQMYQFAPDFAEELMKEAFETASPFKGLPAALQGAMAQTMSPEQLAAATGASVQQAAAMQNQMRLGSPPVRVSDPTSSTGIRLVPREIAMGGGDISAFPEAPSQQALVSVDLGGAPEFVSERGKLMNDIIKARNHPDLGPNNEFTRGLERELQNRLAKSPEVGGKLAAIFEGAQTLDGALRRIAPVIGYDSETGKPVRRLNQKVALQMIDLPFFSRGVPFTEGRMVAAQLEEALQAKLRAETGAAANQQEIINIAQRFMPNRLTDSEEAIIDKLERLQRWYYTALDITDPALAATLRERAGKGAVQVSPLLDIPKGGLDAVDEAGEAEAQRLRDELGIGP